VPIFQQALDGCNGKNGTGVTSLASLAPRVSKGLGLAAVVIGLMVIGAGM